MVGAPANKKSTFTKAASIPARQQTGMYRPEAFLDLFFEAAPHLENNFQFFELSTKTAFAKAAFDTLQKKGRKHYLINSKLF